MSDEVVAVDASAEAADVSRVCEYLLRDLGEILHMLATEVAGDGELGWMTPAYVVGLVRVTDPAAASVLVVLMLADSVGGRSPLWDVVSAYRCGDQSLGDAAFELYQRYRSVRGQIDAPTPATSAI
jgi:hypothetical protein